MAGATAALAGASDYLGSQASGSLVFFIFNYVLLILFRHGCFYILQHNNKFMHSCIILIRHMIVSLEVYMYMTYA